MGKGIKEYRFYTAKSYCGKTVRFVANGPQQAKQRAKQLLPKGANFTVQ